MSEKEKAILPFAIVPVKFESDKWQYPVYTGFMTKQGQKVQNWKKRFFILTHDGRLWYFKNEKSKNPQKKEPVYVQCMKFWKSPKKNNCIKIERYPNSFWFFAANPGDRDAWMDKLEEVGCHRCVNSLPSAEPRKYNFQIAFPGINRSDIKNWSSEDVSLWLDLILHSGWLEDTSLRRNETLETFIKALNGKQLEKMSLKDIETKGVVKNADHRDYLFRCISDLKINRLFAYGEYICSEKILNHIGREIDRVSLRNFSAALSDPEVMSETFLNVAISGEDFPLMKYYLKRNELDYESSDEEEENEGEGGVPTSKKKLREERLKKNLLEGINEEKLNIPSRADVIEMPVKLILTDFVRKDWDRASLFLDPIFEKFPPFKKGRSKYRTALIIGPWYIDFEDNHSLCIPRKICGPVASYFSGWEVNWVIKGKTFGEIINTLSEIICIWNTTNVNQKPVPSLVSRLNKRSCQEFVEDILKAFGLENEAGIDVFIDILRTIKIKGSADCLFIPSKEFIEAFKLGVEKKKEEEGEKKENVEESGGDVVDSTTNNEEVIEDMGFSEVEEIKVVAEESKPGEFRFDTHRDLDVFVSKLKSTNEAEWMSTETFKGEKRLLKCFDRAMWLQHYNTPNYAKYVPSEEGCFYGPSKGNFSVFEKLN